MDEIMRLYGVEEQTVRNWCKSGLERVGTKGRFLVRGDRLNAFHADRKMRAKQLLTLTEFLCLRCHMPREPAPGSVIGALINTPSLRLEASCSVCGIQMYRVWSKKASAALLARPDFLPLSLFTCDSEATGPLSNQLNELPELRRIAMTCDSVNPTETVYSRKSTLTPEEQVKTSESSQLSLPLGF